MTLRVVTPDERKLLTPDEERKLFEALTIVGLTDLAHWVEESPGISFVREPF